MKRTRKHFTAPEKLALLRRHLIDKTPVSTVCDEAKVQPTVFYRWLKQLFENGAAALERSNGATDTRPDLKAQRRIQHLEDRLRTKDGVLAELMEEHVALKKNNRGER
jgi:transposase-like protein